MSSRGRPGRGASAGFYDYFADGSKALWPGLADLFGGQVELAVDDIRDRLMFRMVVEAAHCLHEGVLSNVRAGNIGSILSFGFPLHTAGGHPVVRSLRVVAFYPRAPQ